MAKSARAKTQAERLEQMSIILDGVVQYIKQQEEERTRERMAALHNTRLLLRNYHKLIRHYETAICSERDLEGAAAFDIDLMVDHFSDKEVTIESINLSRKRTIIMMGHFKTCLRLLEQDYSRQPEKFKAFYLFYIDEDNAKLRIGERYEYIANIIHCSERAARNWIDELVEALSVLLWGVDGLKPKNILGTKVLGIK